MLKQSNFEFEKLKFWPRLKNWSKSNKFMIYIYWLIGIIKVSKPWKGFVVNIGRTDLQILCSLKSKEISDTKRRSRGALSQVSLLLVARHIKVKHAWKFFPSYQSSRAITRYTYFIPTTVFSTTIVFFSSHLSYSSFIFYLSTRVRGISIRCFPSAVLLLLFTVFPYLPNNLGEHDEPFKSVQ